MKMVMYKWSQCGCHPTVMMWQPSSLKESMRICFVFVFVGVNGIAWVFVMAKLEFIEPNDIGACSCWCDGHNMRPI